MNGLDYKILKNKPQIKYNDSEEGEITIDDLLARVWRNDEETYMINPIYVSEHYVARPDLISLAIYGTDEYGDLICKYNGISNPFELNEGMIISCPGTEWMTESLRTREVGACELITDENEMISGIKKKLLRTDPHSSSEVTAGTAPSFVIDRSLGLVIY